MYTTLKTLRQPDATFSNYMSHFIILYVIPERGFSLWLYDTTRLKVLDIELAIC